MSKKYFLLIILLLILSVKIYAWWSAPLLGNSTHYKLTQKALEQIDGNEYADIERFGPKMCDWSSGSSDDANAHGKKYNSDAELYDGGPFREWWYYPKENDGFTVKYAARNFVNGEYSAYYFIALMAHLIADQAVPAHAANIFHANAFISIPLNPDNLEKAADGKSPQEGGVKLLSSIFHYYYFKDDTVIPAQVYGSIDATQKKLANWKLPNQNNYWLENDSTKYIGEKYDSIWGKYGGNNGKDIYDVDKDGQDIITEQFYQAVSYMVGFFQMASKRIGPLVGSLNLNNSDFISGQKVLIGFLVDENRKPNVKVKITVDNKAIKTASKAWDGTTEDRLGWNPDLTQLPYQSAFQVSWTGLLSDGTYPSNGQHVLAVQVQDADGNFSEEIKYQFTINATFPCADKPVKMEHREEIAYNGK